MIYKFRKYVFDLYDNISYMGVNDQQSNNDRDLTILLNRYFVLCSIIFFIHGLSNVLYFRHFAWDNIALFIFSALAIVLNRVVIGRNLLKPVLATIVFALTIIVTYYSSFCGIESGMFLFYFPLFAILHLFFDYKTDKYLVIILSIFILILMYISASSDFKIIEKNPDIGTYVHTLLILNITCILLLLSINFIFFIDKRDDYYFILHRNTLKRMEIENLNQEVFRLKNMLNKDDFSEGRLEELINYIHLNDVVFLEKFDFFFPEFKTKLSAMTEVPLNVAEQKLCAMLKLGFSTKQIAIYTNSTIKSVEGKKYRLRKKLDLSSTSDNKIWFADV